MNFDRTRRLFLTIVAATTLTGAPAAVAQETGTAQGRSRLGGQLAVALADLDGAAEQLAGVEGSIESQRREVQDIATDFNKTGDKDDAGRRLEQVSARVDDTERLLFGLGEELDGLADTFRKIAAQAQREKLDSIATAATEALSEIDSLQKRVESDGSRIGAIRAQIEDLKKKVGSSR